MNMGERRPVLCLSNPANSVLAASARELDWQVLRHDEGMSDAHRDSVALVVMDDMVPEAGSRVLFPHALFAALSSDSDADLEIPGTANEESLRQLLRHSETHWRRNLKVTQLATEVGVRRQRLRQLSEIGTLLSTQQSLDSLLETILTEARKIASCEGGSLYLVDEKDDPPSLVFKLAQNSAFEATFVETRLPMTPTSIAGYVATSGGELNIADVYELSPDLPYRFNCSFDEKVSYRTRSMLVLPMRDHRDRVVGVLQFVNRVDRSGQPAVFDAEIVEVVRAVASQAAISVQRSTLVQNINDLFEGFVKASVKTIEQRDPSTSGHSFRVAESTVALMDLLPASGLSRFRDIVLGEEERREIRYAALLHDFGKIGVREKVLLKSNKLEPERFAMLEYRFELQRERLRRRAAERELHLLHSRPVDFEVARRRVHRELEKQLSRLNDYWQWLVKANEPNLLEDGDFRHLIEVREERFLDIDGTIGGLIDDNDLLSLSVRRGSLTPAERREIQSHVVHTKEFLSHLPWPPELAAIPAIAGAHHERLDGSGYPDGLIGEQIPLGAKVMAVCDIYDALTAMDRPYKSAITPDRAAEILHDEARRGLIDQDIVSIFVNARLHEKLLKNGTR
ncbi:MAG: GAF domain-containing protein [Pseudomonadales bacterium]|nr:GAF domain-containing protein [Pseudomonadales bacterium]